MLKNWFLVGLILLVVPWLLVGCGVSEQQYYAVVAERDSIKAELQSTRSELDVVKLELESVYIELTMTKTELQVLKDQVSQTLAAPAPPPVLAPAPILPEPVSQPESPAIARIGDTIPICIAEQELSMTLLWWKESDIALYHLFGYQIYTAVPGRKFIILAYEFRNDAKQQQITPFSLNGEIVTAPKGYCYKHWKPFLADISPRDYNHGKQVQKR